MKHKLQNRINRRIGKILHEISRYSVARLRTYHTLVENVSQCQWLIQSYVNHDQSTHILGDWYAYASRLRKNRQHFDCIFTSRLCSHHLRDKTIQTKLRSDYPSIALPF